MNIFPYGNKISIQSRLKLKGWAKRPKTSNSCIKKSEIAQNCHFFPSLPLPFPMVIAFHRVKESALITGIVDRLKINSEQLYPFSESELTHTVSANCTLRHIKASVCLFRGDRSVMNKSWSATCLLYSDVVKGDQSPRWLKNIRKYQE